MVILQKEGPVLLSINSNELTRLTLLTWMDLTTHSIIILKPILDTLKNRDLIFLYVIFTYYK